jgi:hypothetical protein
MSEEEYEKAREEYDKKVMAEIARDEAWRKANKVQE